MDSRGLSLLELVIATAVLVIAGLAVSTLGIGTTSGNTRTEDRTAALALATAKLEELKNVRFASLANGSESAIEPDGTAGGIFTRAWTVSSGSLVGSSAKDLTVTVSWNDGSVNLSTRVVEVREEAPGYPVAAIQSWYQNQ